MCWGCCMACRVQCTVVYKGKLTEVIVLSDGYKVYLIHLFYLAGLYLNAIDVMWDRSHLYNNSFDVLGLLYGVHSAVYSSVQGETNREVEVCSRLPDCTTQLGLIAKTRQKLDSQNSWKLSLQRFDKFWIWNEWNDRKRKLLEYAGTCIKKKLVKALLCELISGEF